jgi:hypothetical protein
VIKIGKALAFKSSFMTSLNNDVTNDYKQFFSSLGIPNGSKAGCVVDACRSLPFINDNWMAFTEKVLENSYQSFVNSFIDLEHDESVILGNIVKAELIKAEGQPTIVRVCAAMWKDIMDNWGIEDLMSEQWSMEAKTNTYAFIVNGNIVEWNKAPQKWRDSVHCWYEGVPVYDDFGHRVGLLLGGIDGTVDFSGLALLSWKNPADSLTKTNLMVASKITQEGGNMVNFTQEQLNEAVKVAKAEKDTEYAPKLQELDSKLQQANASITEKDAKIKELETKLAEAELKIQAESNRAAIAEAEIAKRDTEKRFEERKTILASKNYPADLLEDEKEFIASASQEDFDKFVAKFEKLTAAMNVAKAASVNNIQDPFSVNLTKDSNSGEKFNPFL